MISCCLFMGRPAMTSCELKTACNENETLAFHNEKRLSYGTFGQGCQANGNTKFQDFQEFFSCRF